MSGVNTSAYMGSVDGYVRQFKQYRDLMMQRPPTAETSVPQVVAAVQQQSYDQMTIMPVIKDNEDFKTLNTFLETIDRPAPLREPALSAQVALLKTLAEKIKE